MEECDTLGEYIDDFIPKRPESATGSSVEVRLEFLQQGQYKNRIYVDKGMQSLAK